MVGQHQWLNGHEFEETPGNSSVVHGIQRIGHDLVTEQPQQPHYTDMCVYGMAGRSQSPFPMKALMSCLLDKFVERLECSLGVDFVLYGNTEMRFLRILFNGARI